VDTNELQTLDLLHCSPLMLMGACSARLAHIEGEVVLVSHSQVSDLLTIVVGDQAYHCFVVSKLNDGIGVMFGHAVLGEQGVQEGTKYTPLRGPNVKDQNVVAYFYHLGATHQEVEDPVAEGCV
jgi:hypothetical protein